MGFVELRAHSAFSFGDGSASPEALATRAASLGYSAIGITDTADLGGIVRFGLESARQNVKPIVGAELVIDGCPACFSGSDEGRLNNSGFPRHKVARRLSSRRGRKEMERRRRGRPRISWQQVSGAE